MKKLLIILCLCVFLMVGVTSVFAGEIKTEGFKLNPMEKKVVEITLKKAGLNSDKADVLFTLRDAIGCEVISVPLIAVDAIVIVNGKTFEGSSVMPKGQEFRAAQKALKNTLASE